MSKHCSKLGAMLPVALLAASCVSPNPEYCDETRPCRDEAKPFCDIEGQYAASNYTANVCIPDPRTSDGGGDDATADAGADSTTDSTTNGDQGQADASTDSLSAAKLASATTEHDFGSVSQGAQSTLLTVTVQNSGQLSTGEIAAALTGPNASEMVIVQDDCADATLAADQTCDVQLRLAPQSLGAKNARLDLSADPGGTLNINLSGTGVAPAALQLKTTLHDFGTVTRGATSTTQLFSVSNDGDVATGSIGVSLDDPEHFVLSQNNCGGTLAPTASCDIKVAFAPKAAGKHNATLVIESDPGGRTTAALIGTGRAAVSVTVAGTGQGTVTSDPAGLNCGATCSADFTTATVTLAAEAQGDSCFVGWSKACTGREPTCTLTLDQAKTVQADFNEPAVLFTLKTTATGSEAPFDPVVGNTGCVLTWDFGDGSSRVKANSVSHTYTAAGEKTVTVLSPDGGAHVTYFKADRRGLTGEIPDALASLPNLTTLLLASNDVSGSIPAGLGRPAMRILDLSGNKLSGQIPAQLGDMANLETLNLSNNQLTGAIPTQLGNLSQLEALYLDTNNLSGAIPAGLSKLSKLRWLRLSSNELTGSIPVGLGSLPNLQVLSLLNNELSGPIPATLGNLSKLEELILVGNSLSGPIPPELAKLSSLKGLSLSHNKLTGSIPVELGSLSNLRGLHLGANQISGTIPGQLGSLSKLAYLTLFENELNGVAPGVLGSFTEIVSIFLSDNALSQQAVDAIVDQIYRARDNYDNSKPKSLYLEGATNTMPSASSILKIIELETDTYKWRISYNFI